MTRSHSILNHGMNKTAVEYAQDRTREDGETRHVYRDRSNATGRRWYVRAGDDVRPANTECIAVIYRKGSNAIVREIDPTTDKEVVFE